MTPQFKRSYHPLVSYCYFHNLLSQEQLHQIPKSTLQYWDDLQQNKLFGHEWFSTHEKEQLRFLVLQQQRFTRICIKSVLKVLHCFQLILKQCAGFKKSLRKHADSIVDVILFIKPYVALHKLCRYFSISTQQFYNWKNKQQCLASPFRWCFKRYPFQLTPKACRAIERALENKVYPFLPKVSVYYQLMNTEAIACSLSSFYKYAAYFLAGKQETKKIKPDTKAVLNATRCFEYLHIDTTLVQTINDGIQRLIVIKDNFSKAILHFACVDGKKSTFVAQVIKDTFIKYNLMNYKNPIHLVSDNGSENKGEVLAWIASLNGAMLKKTVGENGFLLSNNAIESVFNTFKNQFAPALFQNKEELYACFEEFILYYNRIRYPGDLYGLHPIDVLNGQPINKTRFTRAIQTDKQQRYQTNISMSVCKTCAL
jgi:hypothetical protein